MENPVNINEFEEDDLEIMEELEYERIQKIAIQAEILMIQSVAAEIGDNYKKIYDALKQRAKDRYERSKDGIDTEATAWASAAYNLKKYMDLPGCYKLDDVYEFMKQEVQIEDLMYSDLDEALEALKKEYP